jgi:urease subunit alpha
VRNTRGIGLPDMVRNTRQGTVQVAARDGAVRLDGVLLESSAAESVSLARLYFL